MVYFCMCLKKFSVLQGRLRVTTYLTFVYTYVYLTIVVMKLIEEGGIARRDKVTQNIHCSYGMIVRSMHLVEFIQYEH